MCLLIEYMEYRAWYARHAKWLWDSPQWDYAKFLATRAELNYPEGCWRFEP